jgi:hypothetical protein
MLFPRPVQTAPVIEHRAPEAPAGVRSLAVGEAHSTSAMKRDTYVRMLVYISTLFVDFILAVTSAWLLVRRIRQRAIDEHRENLKMLVEGTLRDHGRGRDEGPRS